MATEQHALSYQDVERLCERHLAHRSRIDIAGPKIVRYEPREIQRFRPAFPHINALLLERIDFDRAFRQIDKRNQKVLIAWYGRPDWTQQQAAEWVGCSPSTLRHWRRLAISALRDLLTLDKKGATIRYDGSRVR